MWYPVCETKEEFERDWYIADGFGSNRNTYYHSGLDINLKTGGNSDLGYPVYAMFDGELVYYHKDSHPTTSFGRHLVIRCETPLGTRWLHYAHLQEQDFMDGVQTVQEGQLLGRIGTSGTRWAHLHFNVYKVDPSTLSRGIDSIATTTHILNKYWEDPNVLFASQGVSMPDEGITYNVEGVGEVTIPVPEKQLLTIDKFLQDERERLKQARDERDDLQTQLDIYKDEHDKEVKDLKARIAGADEAAKEYKARYKDYVAKIAGKLGTTQDEPAQMAELTRLIAVEDDLPRAIKERDFFKDELDVAYEAVRRLKETIKDLEEQLKAAKGLKDATDDELLKEYLKRRIEDFEDVIATLKRIWRKS